MANTPPPRARTEDLHLRLLKASISLASHHLPLLHHRVVVTFCVHLPLRQLPPRLKPSLQAIRTQAPQPRYWLPDNIIGAIVSIDAGSGVGCNSVYLLDYEKLRPIGTGTGPGIGDQPQPDEEDSVVLVPPSRSAVFGAYGANLRSGLSTQFSLMMPLSMRLVPRLTDERDLIARV